ncbi:MAG: hypothetical protein GF330_01375 [Candidatus Eisenbacteria bacterium]|nr:hypothetical protein [Candidatus Eisenbacteria bacterium]
MISESIRRSQGPTGTLWVRGSVLALLCLLGPLGAAAEIQTYDIYELQRSGPELDWRSPHAGEIVRCVGGIVTHEFRQRIVLQDPTLGHEWAAIEVRGYPVYPTGIEVGDQVDFDSVYVDEYRGVTVLQYYNASDHQVNASGQCLPDPVSLSVWNLRHPAHPEDAERYAAMLVSVSERVTIGERDLGNHGDNYELCSYLGDTAWGSDYANVDSDSTYYVATGDCYVRLAGIVQRYDNDGEWDYYQLLPRGTEDYIACGATAVTKRPVGASRRLRVWSATPSSDPTSLMLELPHPAWVRIDLYDASGRWIGRTHEARCPAGHSVLGWRSCGLADRNLPSGIYLLRIRANHQQAAERICLMR